MPQSLKLKYGNRHGLIAGATGTGKTVTLQIMAEEFSVAGVPVGCQKRFGGIGKIGQRGFQTAWCIHIARRKDWVSRLFRF